MASAAGTIDDDDTEIEWLPPRRGRLSLRALPARRPRMAALVKELWETPSSVDMPIDMLRQIMMETDPEDLLDMCALSRALNRVCEDPEFQREYIKQHPRGYFISLSYEELLGTVIGENRDYDMRPHYKRIASFVNEMVSTKGFEWHQIGATFVPDPNFDRSTVTSTYESETWRLYGETDITNQRGSPVTGLVEFEVMPLYVPFLFEVALTIHPGYHRGASGAFDTDGPSVIKIELNYEFTGPDRTDAMVRAARLLRGSPQVLPPLDIEGENVKYLEGNLGGDITGQMKSWLDGVKIWFSRPREGTPVWWAESELLEYDQENERLLASAVGDTSGQDTKDVWGEPEANTERQTRLASELTIPANVPPEKRRRTDVAARLLVLYRGDVAAAARNMAALL